MKLKNLLLRALLLLSAGIVIALSATEYLEKGALPNLPKLLLALASIGLAFTGTFLSKIDRADKSKLKDGFGRYAACFDDDAKGKRLFYRGYRAWYANNSATAYYYLQKAADTAKYSDAKARAHYFIGLCALKEQKHSRALENFQAAAGLDPRFAPVWEAIAAVYLELGRREEARDACEKGLAFCPQSVSLWSKLAKYYFDLCDYQQALKHSLEAERMNPSNPVAIANVALAYAGVGDEQKAEGKLLIAQNLGYQNIAAARERMSGLLRRARQANEALRQAERADAGSVSFLPEAD